MIVKTMLVALMCVTMVGCAGVPQKVVWDNQFEKGRVFEQDRLRCDYEAEMATPVTSRMSMVEAMSQGMNKSKYFSMCMASKGWVKTVIK